MGNLNMDFAALAYVDGFSHRFVDCMRLVADMRRISCAIAFEDLAKRSDLFGFGVKSRRRE